MANKVKNRASQAAAQARSRAKDIQYKSEAARLKKIGVLTNKVDARKKITRATRTKINKFRDVLEGRAIVVKAPRDVRESYENKGIFESVGQFVKVPVHKEGTKAKLRTNKTGRSFIQVIEPMKDRATGLKTGTWEKVVLPYAPADMLGLVEELRSDPTIDGMKEPDEMFTFQIDGWATEYNAVDAEELADTLQNKYAHLFDPKSTQSVVRYISLYKFRGNTGFVIPDHKHRGLSKKPGWGKGRDEDQYELQNIRVNKANRNKRYEKNMTVEQKADRLQRKRAASIARRSRAKADKKGK